METKTKKKEKRRIKKNSKKTTYIKKSNLESERGELVVPVSVGDICQGVLGGHVHTPTLLKGH